jgi:hypothetical protein
MYGKPFGIKTHKDKGFATIENYLIFRIESAIELFMA